VSTDSKQTNDDQTIEVRKGQVTGEAFRDRFMARFYDPAFRAEDQSLVRLESIAWDAYCASRKSPITEKAGPEFADPDYDLSVEWRAASERIKAAQKKQKDQFFESGARSRLDRFIGYYEPYATSHATLDHRKTFSKRLLMSLRHLPLA
jgi:hypothetical protein